MWLPKDRQVVVKGTDRVNAKALARGVSARARDSRQSGVIFQNALVRTFVLLFEHVRVFFVAALLRLLQLLLLLLFSLEHAKLEFVDFLPSWDQPKEQEGEERAAETDDDKDIVIAQVGYRDPHEAPIDPGTKPASQSTSEAGDRGQQGEAGSLDAFRANLGKYDGHGQEDEALGDDLRDHVREDDQGHVRDAPLQVQTQHKRQSQRS